MVAVGREAYPRITRTNAALDPDGVEDSPRFHPPSHGRSNIGPSMGEKIFIHRSRLWPTDRVHPDNSDGLQHDRRCDGGRSK